MQLVHSGNFSVIDCLLVTVSKNYAWNYSYFGHHLVDFLLIENFTDSCLPVGLLWKTHIWKGTMVTPAISAILKRTYPKFGRAWSWTQHIAFNTSAAHDVKHPPCPSGHHRLKIKVVVNVCLNNFTPQALFSWGSSMTCITLANSFSRPGRWNLSFIE